MKRSKVTEILCPFCEGGVVVSGVSDSEDPAERVFWAIRRLEEVGHLGEHVAEMIWDVQNI